MLFIVVHQFNYFHYLNKASKLEMMKKIILAAILLLGSVFALTIYSDTTNFKKLVIPSFGSIDIPKEWNVIMHKDGIIFCSISLCPSDGIVYMFQFEYEKRQNDWFIVNNEIGSFMVLGVDHDGKNGIYSNNTQITTLNILINDETHRYYQLDMWTTNQDKVMFLVNAEYVGWPVVKKILLSFSEIS